MVLASAFCFLRRSAVYAPGKLHHASFLFAPALPASSRFQYLKFSNSCQSLVKNRDESIQYLRRTGRCLNNEPQLSLVWRRCMSAAPPTLQQIHDRVMFVLKMFDKIEVDKLTATSHFAHDLGLNSLDHVEIIIHVEDDFDMEIPEHVMDRLQTPDDIIQYLGDRYNVEDYQYVPASKEELLDTPSDHDKHH